MHSTPQYREVSVLFATCIVKCCCICLMFCSCHVGLHIFTVNYTTLSLSKSVGISWLVFLGSRLPSGSSRSRRWLCSWPRVLFMLIALSNVPTSYVLSPPWHVGPNTTYLVCFFFFAWWRCMLRVSAHFL